MGFADHMELVDRDVRQLLGEDEITYTPGVGEAVVVSGIFDANYQHVELGEPGIASVGPAVFLTLADLPSHPKTDTAARITRASATYKVHTAEPAGMGSILLRLHKV